MGIKEFEERNKEKINKYSSLLLSFSIHVAIIAGLFIMYKKVNIPEPIPKEKRVKVELKNYVLEKVEVKEVKNKKIKKERKKEKKKEEKTKSEVQNKIIKKYPSKGIEKSYGERFFELREEEQKYLIKNWDINNQINEIVSLSAARNLGLEGVDENDSNTVIFHLYPDGNISEIKFEKERKDSKFDMIVKETILGGYRGYDKPKEKTLIRIFISVGKEN